MGYGSQPKETATPTLPVNPRSTTSILTDGLSRLAGPNSGAEPSPSVCGVGFGDSWVGLARWSVRVVVLMCPNLGVFWFQSGFVQGSAGFYVKTVC